MFRDAKHGAALQHLPSGHPEINRAWMWGALLGVTLASWLHQLTATPRPEGALAGHGVRDGQAMIATLRHRLIRVPARLVHHAGALILGLGRREPPAASPIAAADQSDRTAVMPPPPTCEAAHVLAGRYTGVGS